MNSTFFDKKSSHKQLKAVVNDDVLNVITKMGGIMQERGYPLKNLQSALDELKNESAMDMVLTSKADGEIQEEDLDKLTRVPQADILVSIAFTRQNVGPRQQVEFRVTSIDAATNKQIGGETGRSSASGAPISALLEESVLGFMDNFTASIQRHVGGLRRPLCHHHAHPDLRHIGDTDLSAENDPRGLHRRLRRRRPLRYALLQLYHGSQRLRR